MKYEKAIASVILFDNGDVVTASVYDPQDPMGFCNYQGNSHHQNCYKQNRYGFENGQAGKTSETCPRCGQTCTYRRRLRHLFFILLRPSSEICVPNGAKYALYSAVVSTPCLGRKAAHRRSQGETRGSFMRSAQCSVGCIRCPVSP